VGTHKFLTDAHSLYETKNKKLSSIIMFKYAALSLVSLAAADKGAIDAQLKALVANSSLRAFTGNIANAVAQLDEYGCWCYFYDNVGRGKGTPVDEIDGFCKILGDGYQCAIIDSEGEGLSCIPWEVAYSSGTGAGVNLAAACNTNNPDDNCAARACAVEGQFVDSLFAFLLSGSQINYNDFGHNNGFDAATDAGCPVKKGTPGVSGEKLCCGAYPTRFPFKTLDGDRACCGGRTYNTQLLNCCSPGQVKANC
jgi:hypothetical protein